MKTIFLLRKPLEGNLVGNTLAHGCGGLNIDAARIPTTDNLNGGAYASSPQERHDGKESWRYERGGAGSYVQPIGRYPANFLLADIETAKGLDNQSGFITHSHRKSRKDGHSSIWGSGKKSLEINEEYRDSGGAYRFFKCLEEDK